MEDERENEQENLEKELEKLERELIKKREQEREKHLKTVSAYLVALAGILAGVIELFSSCNCCNCSTQGRQQTKAELGVFILNLSFVLITLACDLIAITDYTGSNEKLMLRRLKKARKFCNSDTEYKDYLYWQLKEIDKKTCLKIVSIMTIFSFAILIGSALSFAIANII